MSLDYSQKRLINAPLGKHHRRSKRLQMYAFFTGLASTIISLALVILEAIHK
jgi:hypothetical protein